jgi:hypothetical protein
MASRNERLALVILGIVGGVSFGYWQHSYSAGLFMAIALSIVGRNGLSFTLTADSQEAQGK